MAGQPLAAPEVCLELADQSVRDFPAAEFFGADARDRASQAARLAAQFAHQNSGIFAAMDSRVESRFDGRELRLRVVTGAAVGAAPLLSPTTARPDFGLIIQPRFPWGGIGQMLGEMGWRVIPSPLRLPLMRRSERRVPPWVLSTMLLARLQALVKSLARRFVVTEASCPAPRGRVLWSAYATRSLPRGGAIPIPCAYPGLGADLTLKSAIRFALERQRASLQGQLGTGAFVAGLVRWCEALLTAVRDAPAVPPSPHAVKSWLARPMRGAALTDGVQAIEWIAEERGLAGASDLEGIPWRMDMNQFFEAYVETLAEGIARRLGGKLRTGRRRESAHPIHWLPPFPGSQQALVPDIWLEWPGVTLVIDAKYKRHWDEWRWSKGAGLSEAEQGRHRTDLLQVLAYANLARSDRVAVCLAYPCGLEAWSELRAAGLAVRRAAVAGAARPLSIWLAGVPMELSAERSAGPIEDAVRALLAAARRGVPAPA